ncbi:MAG: ATP-binding protein [Euryarchaeota archaeon]|nr:ATP-binding protein [Euryarchaeota archaeon]MDE1837381.1 ATP-binding protein [Euryarchaeota archaeon]MDE1882158.1 ATP-binding protein [Euryarchaeota archaeon]MDE2046518.1 ATP-binding protein [Thermoplasmata archaeon]
MFIGREAELALLVQALTSRRPQFVRVLGRRRVGKTELLRQALAKAPGLLFYVPEADLPSILGTLGDQMVSQTGGPPRPYRSFFDFLDHVQEKAPRLVIFDEFQHLMELGKGVESELQRRWDLSWQRKGPHVVVCGSSIGMMQRLVSGRAPLYGRVSLHLQLKPLTYVEARRFHEGRPEEERIRRYAVFGGIPFYQRESMGGSLEDGILRTLLIPQGSLLNEPEWVLGTEYREPRRYQSILEQLSQGPQSLHALESKLGLATGGLSWYVRSLEHDLDLIRHVEPVLGKKHLGRFEISDSFFRFYYRHILPKRNLIEMDRGAEAMADLLPQIETFVGTTFEEIVHQTLWRAREVKGLPNHPRQVGRWWSRLGEEVDAVCVSDNEVWVGEVKWGTKTVSDEVVAKLMEKASRLEMRGGRAIRPFIVTRGDLTSSARNLLERLGGFWLGMKDLQQLMEEEQPR